LGVIVGRTLNRVAGVVSAAALATFAAAPVALADDETSTSPTETTTSTSTSETTTTTAPTTTETTAPSTSVTTTGTTSAPATTGTKPETSTSTSTSASSEPPKDDFQDNTGAGFVGLGGEGVLVINCAAGAPGNLAAQYLSVTGGPDQDESDGRTWNYTVRVDNLPAGTTTGKFSWTCNGVEGNGTVEFQQPEVPPTSTSGTPTSSSTVPSSTAPVTTATSTATTTATTTTTAPGNSAPKAQVKVAPKGGVETGFGGTAR
jgi:hypothetical protein